MSKIDTSPAALRSLADYWWDEHEKRRCERDRLKALNAELVAALKSIEAGCSFPSDDVQRAVRDRARTAIAKAEAS